MTEQEAREKLRTMEDNELREIAKNGKSDFWKFHAAAILKERGNNSQEPEAMPEQSQEPETPPQAEPEAMPEKEEKAPAPRRRKSLEEREKELAARRDALNKELAEIRAQKNKQERRERNHRLILFGAAFEKKILDVCKWDSREKNDEEIRKLAAKILAKIS